MLSTIAVESRDTDMDALEEVVANSVSVTPSTTLVTVLVDELRDNPFIVNAASCGWRTCERLEVLRQMVMVLVDVNEKQKAMFRQLIIDLHEPA